MHLGLFSNRDVAILASTRYFDRLLMYIPVGLAAILFGLMTLAETSSFRIAGGTLCDLPVFRKVFEAAVANTLRTSGRDTDTEAGV